MTLPAGFRFCPTDQELVTSYLLKKVNREPLPWNGIVEYDLYSNKAPWQIFGHLDDPEEEKVYLFTRLKKASKNRVARSAGCGTWHKSYSEKIYQHQIDRVIRSKKLFCFKAKEGTSMRKTNWLMHEFSLSGEQGKTTELVLYVIQKKAERRIRVKRNFEDRFFTSQEPAAITPIQTLCLETLETTVNDDMLPVEDGTQQRKRMRCDVESSPEATETVPECSDQCKMDGSTIKCLPSESIVDIKEDTKVSSTQIPELETNGGGYLSECDASISNFYASYGYLPPLPSPKSGDGELHQWIE